MKKMKIEGMAEMLEVYNPMVLRDEKGVIMSFADYSECYFELIKRFYGVGGPYVDLVLFVVETWGLSEVDAVRFVRTWHSLVDFPKEGFVVVDWMNGGKERDKMIEGVVNCCHTLTKTKFDRNMFLSALNKFKLNFLITN